MFTRAIRTDAQGCRDGAPIDDARIDLTQALIVDAEFCLHIGTEILDHHVGLFHEPLEHFEAPRVFQVERHRPLVAVQILEVEALARPAQLLAAGVLQQRVDLDDVGARVPQAAARRSDPREPVSDQAR